MKHPLTSKERRGLTAVAAAALLCIGSGFLFRQCGSGASGAEAGIVITDNDSVAAADKPDSIPPGKRGRRARRKKAESKKKTEKAYPVRSPLDQPCD